MKEYYIYVVEKDSGKLSMADPKPYEGETEIEALRQFVKQHSEDISVNQLTVISEEPFLLRINGLVYHPETNTYETHEHTYQYVAKERLRSKIKDKIKMYS